MTLAAAYKGKADRLAAPTEMTVVRPRILHVVHDGPPDAKSEETMLMDPGVVEHARELVDRHPDSPTAYARLAQAELASGLWFEAQATAAIALKLAISDVDVPAVVAASEALITLGQLDLAEEGLRQLGDGYAPSTFTRAVLDTHRGRFDDAIARLAESQDLAARDLRGWLHLQLRNYELAIRDFKFVARSSLPSAEILTNLGYAYAAVGLLDKAIEATRQAVHLAPSDRTATFNLVAYYVALGEFESALEVLYRLRAHHPDDFKIAAAIADTNFRCDNGLVALKELQKVLARGRADASTIDLAELRANIVFLEWRLRRRTKAKTCDALRKELLRSDFASLRIAELLANLFTRRVDIGQLQTLYDGLREFYPVSKLYRFETRLLYLRGEFDAALQVALAWREEQPFDPEPSIVAGTLLSYIRGDHKRAVEIELEALKFHPADEILRNNVAYVLALSGDTSRARRVLTRDEESPYVVATRGLIEIVDGRVDAGLDLYDRAADLAVEWGKTHDEPQLSQLIRLRKEILILERGLQRNSQVLRTLWDMEDDDPRVHLFRAAVRRFRPSSHVSGAASAPPGLRGSLDGESRL